MLTTLLALTILVAVPTFLWNLAKRADGRYRDGGYHINVKRVGR